jgi:protein subunit release factor B
MKKVIDNKIIEHKMKSPERELKDFQHIEKWIAWLEKWKDCPNDPVKWKSDYERALETRKRHLVYISSSSS